ncbi:MAG: recombination protein O N-terminal domain-containing protein [Treponema sp.]|jgi:DNA repair protein RecO (recombination protein O)|nr:recombination protein O N-terminal domain-containing protein [Treponema sp.]
MSRTIIYSALSLRCRPSGESNSEVTLLTAEEGIIKATVFGGAKNKLRSHSSPYNSGQVWIYRDPAKEHRSLSDFDVRSWRPGLRELYERTMAACGIAETILASHGGGGEWSKALSLAEKALDTLETADEEKCERILVRFLWRWIEFLGIQPEFWDSLAYQQPQGSNFEGQSSNLYQKSLAATKALVTGIMSDVIGKRLSSWDW